MDRYGRCPHCGHPSPPPSPGILLDDNGLPLTGVGSHSLQAHRISPPVSATSTIQSYTGATLPLPDWNSWDAVQMDAEKTLESQELVEPEPELSADLYRTLWDLLGLTIITVISLICAYLPIPPSYCLTSPAEARHDATRGSGSIELSKFTSLLPSMCVFQLEFGNH